MTEIIAYHVAAPGAVVGLHHFQEQVVVTLPLPSGLYTVHARVGIGSSDHDDQAVFCGVRIRSSFKYIDRIDSRQDGPNRGFYYPLQAVVQIYEDDSLDLIAGTYEGWWQDPSLIASRVDGIVPPV